LWTGLKLTVLIKTAAYRDDKSHHSYKGLSWSWSKVPKPVLVPQGFNYSQLYRSQVINVGGSEMVNWEISLMNK